MPTFEEQVLADRKALDELVRDVEADIEQWNATMESVNEEHAKMEALLDELERLGSWDAQYCCCCMRSRDVEEDEGVVFVGRGGVEGRGNAEGDGSLLRQSGRSVDDEPSARSADPPSGDHGELKEGGGVALPGEEHPEA